VANPASPGSDTRLSVVVPVYNERFTVEQLIDEVLAAPLPAGMTREVVVVDDASTDGTRELLDALATRRPEVRVLHHDKNRGKGAAIRTGVAEVTGDFCVVQDADLEYNPRDYGRLLGPLLHGDADVVYGSRFLTSDYRRVLFFWHSVGNRILTLLSNALTDLDLTDMETCYKMARTEILKSIPIRCNRFGVEPELTAKFAKRGCRIYEVPISYRGRTYEEGKKITWRDGVKALFIMLYFRLVDDLYDEKYGHAILYRLSGAHRFSRWMADTISPWVGQDVLEIGAGMGNLARRLLPRRSYLASDIDPLNLAFLRNLFNRQRRVEVAEIDVGQPDHFVPLREQFDTVISLNVIEHVEADQAALAHLFSALRPGGTACLLVPCGADRYGSLDAALGHRRRYQESEFREKLVAAGFVVEKLFTFNKIAAPAWWLNGQVLKRKSFGRIQLKLFDSLVWLWRLIDRFLPWRGVSLIAIARKP
jgi:glycosyltransferase involved in cell wall biosynthesis